MDAITEITNIDFLSWLIIGFILLSAFVAANEIIGKFSVIIGKPVKWMKKQNEDHNLLTQTAQNLSALQRKHEEDVRQSDKHDEELRNDIKKLTEMFIDKEINDMRWEINNFATKVSEGKPCNKDSYKHCIHTWEKYEKLLAENGLENGEVEISMNIVRESYQEKLKDGF